MFAAIAAVIGWIGSIITSMVALGLAIKLLIIGLVTIILPIVLKNLFLWVMDKTLELASSGMSGLEAPSLTYQFTGIGAYMAENLQLPLCVSILLTAVAIRFILRAMRLI
jgi:hypothetical protein